jgi:hypothetical protein
VEGANAFNERHKMAEKAVPEQSEDPEHADSQ